jgi:1-acyl-sn-glycerol-3-phosphate acyltransferase
MQSDQKPDYLAPPFIGQYWYHVRAAIVLVFITCNLTFWIFPLILMVVLKWLLPISIARRLIDKIMAWTNRAAVQGNSWILFQVLKIRLDVTGIDQAFPGNFYLVIANHQSWSDILILQHVLNRKAPIMKFMVKKELMYLPLVGLICWAYDFPFLQRGKNPQRKSPNITPSKDGQYLSKSLIRFLRSSATIINFAEGTRFSADKATRHQSPFQYLLKPKAGGYIAIYEMIGQELTAALDITIVYDTANLSFWQFIGGTIPRVTVHVDAITATELKESFGLPETSFNRDRVIAWINQQWDRKDKQISRIVSGTQ